LPACSPAAQSPRQQASAFDAERVVKTLRCDLLPSYFDTCFLPHCRRATVEGVIVVRRVTPLLRDIGCVVSQTTAGAETRRVHRARGAGGAACNAPCLAIALSLI